MTAKKRFLTRLLTLLFCLGLVLPVPVRAADLYFTSVDDSLLPLTSATMPVWSGGKLYVPYTVFDRNTTGVDLGVKCIYNRNSDTITLYTPQEMLLLVFDLKNGTCRDEITGSSYDSKAITRNGQPFLPVNFVCDYFDLAHNYTRVIEGYLIRIKSGSAVLSDSDFIDAASDLIERRAREFNQSLIPPTSLPQLPIQPTPSDATPVDAPAGDMRAYLAFRCEQAGELSTILDALDAGNVRAVFFCSPQILDAERDLVRRITGSGHSLGLLAEGQDEAASRDILAEGNSLLARTIHSRTMLAYADESLHGPLESEGWVCWNESFLLTPSDTTSPYTFANNTLSRLKNQTRTTFLTMNADKNTARVLPHLLRQLQINHFLIGTPMETRL